MTRPNKNFLTRLSTSERLAFEKHYLPVCFIESVLSSLSERGIKPSEFARRLGKSPQYVSKLLNHPQNVTLGTMAEIAFALDQVVELSLSSK